jgi:hypothetical protein
MLSAAVRVVCIALGATFAWAAIAKLLGWRRWVEALGRYRLGRDLQSFASVAVPASEAVASALLVGGAHRAGAAVAIGLLAAFSLAVVRARALGDGDAPCGCFGRADVRDYGHVLARNALLTVTAAFVLLAERQTTPSTTGGVAALPVVLVAVGILAMIWLVWQTSASLRRR